MRRLALVACVALCGCASNFVPYTVEIADPVAFDADLRTCQGYANAYQPGVDAGGLAGAGAQGAATNAPAAAVNPLVPVIGALAGTASQALDDLNLSKSQRARITTRCMEAKGDRSRAYLTIDPNR